MKYIQRQLEPEIKKYLKASSPRGVILTGIIGVGKTTLTKKIVSDLSDIYHCFSFSGDDLIFRQAVATDTRYLIKTIRSKTSERALIFVDEIQKTPEILDAVKLAFDDEKMSFVVTGSEPQYLLNEAKRRLQRRARAFSLYPFSLNEIYTHKNLCEKVDISLWRRIIDGGTPEPLLDIKGDWLQIFKDFKSYRPFGTIPLVYQEKTPEEKLYAITNIIDRGYQPIAGLTQKETDTIISEIANLNNREFTYQTILNKTRLKRREKINVVIDFYTNNGLLLSRTRKLFIDYKQSYHIIYSFIDPGLAFYINRKEISAETDNGFDLESIVHAQLRNRQNFYPFSISVYYYTPYYITPSGQIKYKTGSIDFLLESGSINIPIEVKSTNNLNRINVPILEEYVQSGRANYGVVIYQGAPWYDKLKKIYYLPLALL